ncbi:hypothetical protein Taro_015249, partial [Colocasia esculenta]|nr:hypothetical protein [Colocasia esculenta]
GNPQHITVPPVEGVAGGGTGYGWNDGGFRGLCSFSGVVDPTKIPSVELLHVWCMPSTANVGQQEMPRPLEPVGVVWISLLVARNERESTQIAVRPKVSWGGQGTAGAVQIQCSDLCSPSGDRLLVGQALSMRRVVPILGVPDALVPLDLPVSQINLFPGETTAIWVSVDVPAGQPPGQYEGQLFITAVAVETLPSSRYQAKNEKYELYQELKTCLDMVEPLDDRPLEVVVERVRSATSTLRRVLMSPTFNEFSLGSGDVMDEDTVTNLSVSLKFCVTVWDFTLPLTPSLPAVFGVSETVIEDRFGVEHGTDGWYDALDRHFNWLLQYRISPFFCRWGDSMRVLAYTCPWPGNPLNLDQYNSICNMSSEIRAYAPDARVLTTYYCGPSDAPVSVSSFEAFVKVPTYLRPHTQIFCTSEWVLGNREDLVKDILAELEPDNGEEWWTYVCMGPSDPHPNWHLGMRGTQHRAVMWRVWKEGGTGFLYWGANCYEKAMVASAEIRFRRGLPPGDGVLFYPGEVFSSSHEPVASVRLERILSGLQDIEYLKLYSARYGREEGLALLEKTGAYLGPERYTLDHMPIDAMRAEVYRTCRS